MIDWPSDERYFDEQYEERQDVFYEELERVERARDECVPDCRLCEREKEDAA